MVKVYERINWENEPSLNTPLSEGNLNRMDLALDTIDTRVVSHETTKLDVSVANTMVKNITYNEATGVITVEYLNGTTATLDTKLEKLAVNFRYDPETEKLIITLDDGTTQEVDLSSLITEYDFENTDTIAFTVENGVVKAMIPDGAITGDKLEPNYLANCESAKTIAETKALAAEGYSLGTQNKQPVGPDSEYYQNNAKYYKEQARQIVGDVSLESLTDVSLNDVQDGDVLVWNAETEKWVNGQGTPTPKEIEITFTVEGAKADNIAIHDSNGAIVGNVIFGAEETSKEVTLTIPEQGGNYTFESSVAKATDGSGGNYTKNVALTNSVTSVKVMPENALYWYGNNALSNSFTTVIVGSGSTFTKNANSLTFAVTSNNGIRVTSDNNPSYSGFTKMKALATSNLYVEAYIELIKPTSWGSDRYHRAGNITNGVSDFDISGYSDNYFLDFNIGVNGTTTIYALWLE